MPRPKDTTAIVTYGDHEIITPENKLSVAVAKTPGQSGDDPIARAEKALADLSNQFASWMDAECDRLDKARLELAKNPDASSKDALFHAAHDIKGEAATFGFPAVASAAQSLCRLIEHAPDIARVPVATDRPTRGRGARDPSRVCAFRRETARNYVDQTATRRDRRVSGSRKSRSSRGSRAAQGAPDRA